MIKVDYKRFYQEIKKAKNCVGGQYVDYRCPHCGNDDFRDIDKLYDYDEMLFESTDDLFEFLEGEKGLCPAEIFKIINYDVTVITEWDDNWNYF